MLFVLKAVLCLLHTHVVIKGGYSLKIRN